MTLNSKDLASYLLSTLDEDFAVLAKGESFSTININAGSTLD